MRLMGLLGTVAVLMAGCASGGSGQTPAAKVVEVHAPHAHAPSSDTPTHAHTHLENIPAAYRGVYDVSLEACARPSDGRLTISARELRFHESVGTVRSVGYGGPGAISVEADYEGEGQRWRNLRILSLGDNGAKLTIKGEGDSLDRVRCPQGAR